MIEYIVNEIPAWAYVLIVIVVSVITRWFLR